jgi:Flp pilus assembly pilin Flp
MIAATRRRRRSALLRLLGRFRRERKGIAAVEFAMVASVLAIAMLGGVELSYYTLAHQKMDRISSSVGSMTAQSSSTLAVADLNNMFAAAREMARPYDFAVDGVVYISFLSAEADGVARITWQRCGGGVLTETSRLGVEGNIATLPTGMVVKQGDTIVAVEVFARYTAIVFAEVVGGAPIVYKSSFERPRLVDVITADVQPCVPGTLR